MKLSRLLTCFVLLTCAAPALPAQEAARSGSGTLHTTWGPEMDGLQVCRELRNRPTTRSIPVVLLTARADEHTKIECLAAGASDFLAKPFSMTEVNVRLKNLVDSHTYQRELAQQKQQLEAALEQIKETESLLLRNEKLASLGRMSAGLIHEINNPLNYARQGLHILGQNAPLLPEDARADFTNAVSVAVSSRIALKPALQLVWRNQPALTEIELFTPAGAPTGTTVVEPLEKLDSFFTLALVVTL